MITLTNIDRAGLGRRGFLGLSAVAGVAALAACGRSASGGSAQAGGSGGGSAGIRFAWWGNAARQKTIGDFAAKFTAKYPNITVQLEPMEYSGYSDKLAVQAAGQNLPDVFWMPANLVGTYAARGVLYDLSKLPSDALDLKDYPTDVLESWKLGGKHVAPVYTQYSTCMQLDVTALEGAGIKDLPDGESWAWDDLAELAASYAKAKGGENWGITNLASFYQHAHMWIRQNGAEAFTPDGKIGFDAAVVGDWFRWWQKATDMGGVMPTKISAGKTQWTQTAHKTALYLAQLNQVQDNASFSKDHKLRLIKSPANSNATRDYQFKYFTRFCLAGNGKNPEAAAKFVSFMMNDLGNATEVGLASGVPTNPKVVEGIRAKGTDVDKMVLAMQDKIDKQPARPRPEPPVGGSEWQKLVEKAADDIFNGGVAIDTAVKNGIKTLQATLDKG